MKRDAFPILVARGFFSALTTWKGLLVALALNAALAAVLVRPLAVTLHEALDRNPWAGRMAEPADPLLYTNLARAHPDLLGDVGKGEDLLTGATPTGPSASPRLADLLPKRGIAGSAVAFGLLSAALAALLSGGFAGRFGAEKERSSLAAFGGDCARFAFPSLFLGLVSAGFVLAAWRFIYVGTGRFYVPEDFRYEWQAVALTLLRFAAFLVVAAYVRLVVLFARAAMGNAGSGNVAAALGRGLGTVLRRPARAFALEVVFGAFGLLPLVLWGLLGTAWDGKELSDRALVIALQQVVVLARVVSRTAQLGAASAWLSAGAAAAAPAAPTVEAAPAAS